jgi:hypothetical protein
MLVNGKYSIHGAMEHSGMDDMGTIIAFEQSQEIIKGIAFSQSIQKKWNIPFKFVNFRSLGHNTSSI